MRIVHEYREERRQRLPAYVIVGVIIGVFFCFLLGMAFGLLAVTAP